MKTKCSVCNEIYDDKDPENDIFIQNECPMICYECSDKQRDEFFSRINASL